MTRKVKRAIEALAAEAGASSVAVAAHDLADGRTLELNAARWFHAASTIKVPVLLGVFDAIESGRLKPQSRVHVRNRFLSVADGTPYRVEAARDANAEVQSAIGRTMQVRELARHMIATSSNLATNLLIEIVGLEHIQATIDRFRLQGVMSGAGVPEIAIGDARPAQQEHLQAPVDGDGDLAEEERAEKEKKREEKAAKKQAARGRPEREEGGAPPADGSAPVAPPSE